MDEGVEVADSESADDAADDSDTPLKRIPVAADFLIAYATAPGLSYFILRSWHQGV